MAGKAIPTPDQLRQLLRYEPATGRLYWRHRPDAGKAWNTKYAGKRAFTANDGYGYYCGGLNYRTYKAHRVIWAIVNGEWPPAQIDHINGNPRDNRISNLRAVTRAENQRNHKRHSTNSSGHMGVCWHGRAGKWCAYIDAGKRLHLGLFDGLDDAIAARKAAEVEHGFHENHGRVA